MPSPGDPSYDRQERAARAKLAASDASGDRLAELRAKYLAPTSPTRPSRATRSTRATSTPGTAEARAARPQPKPRSPFDAAVIARTAAAALDKHPGTWTSFAELCSATGLTRGLALVVGRQMLPDPTGSHWFRIRDEDGMFSLPADDSDRDGDLDSDRFDRAEADRRLGEAGVSVVDGRADPATKLCWTGNGWAQRGVD